MAYYTNSVLTKAQAKVMGKFQAGELRFRDPVTFKAYLQSGPIMMPGYEQIKQSAIRTVEAYYRKRQSRSLSTGLDADHAGTKGESGVLTPSWTFYNDVFKYSLKQGNNNVYAVEEMVNNEVENVVYNFAEGLESRAATHLFDNRSGTNNAEADGSFNTVQDVYEIFTSKEKRMLQIAKSVMDENKFAGPFLIFADPIAFNKMEFYANQGNANSENLQFQFSGANIIKTVDLYDKFAGLGTPYTDGAFVVVPMGMIAAMPWVEPQYREGKQTLVNRYSTLSNPVDGLSYGVQEYDARSDESAAGGGEQDVVTQVQVHLQIAFDYAPISTSNFTPLMAMALKEATT